MAELVYRSGLARPLTSIEADGNIAELAARSAANLGAISALGDVVDDLVEETGANTDAIEALQAALGPDGQNNVSKIITRVWTSEEIIGLVTVHLYINDFISFEVLPTDSRVWFRFFVMQGGVSYTYVYDFGGGNGVWGAGGSIVEMSMLMLVSVYRTFVDEIEDNDDTVIVPLGEVADGDFLSAANADEHDFTDTDVEYYFSYYIGEVLYLALFIGAPGVYGGGVSADDFVEADFAQVTNSGVPAVPTLQTVMEQGSESVVNTDVVIRRNVTGGFQSRMELNASQAFIRTPKRGFVADDSLAGGKAYAFNENIKFFVPTDKEEDDTFAMLSDVAGVSGLTLQAVTTNGNTTTEDVNFEGAINVSEIINIAGASVIRNDDGTLYINDPVQTQIGGGPSGSSLLRIDDNGFGVVTGPNAAYLKADNLTGTRTHQLPDADGMVLTTAGTTEGNPVTGDIDFNDINDDNTLKLTPGDGDESASLSVIANANFSDPTDYTRLSVNLLQGSKNSDYYQFSFSGDKGITSLNDHTANITDFDYPQKKYVDKQGNIKNNTVDSSTLTGTTTEATMATVTIPANTLSAGKLIIEAPFDKTGSGGTVLVSIYRDSTLLGIFSGAAGNRYIPFRRTFLLKADETLWGYNATNNASIDGFSATGQSPQSTAFDFDTTFDLIIKAQLASSTDSATLKGLLVKFEKSV